MCRVVPFKKNTNKLEMTHAQQRTARFAMNNYDKYASVTNI